MLYLTLNHIKETPIFAVVSIQLIVMHLFNGGDALYSNNPVGLCLIPGYLFTFVNNCIYYSVNYMTQKNKEN